jgi:hypothetical protein
VDDREIVIIYTDDWERMYVNGNLVHDHHPLSGDEMLDVLGIKYTLAYVDTDTMVRVCDTKSKSLAADREIFNSGLDGSEPI